MNYTSTASTATCFANALPSTTHPGLRVRNGLHFVRRRDIQLLLYRMVPIRHPICNKGIGGDRQLIKALHESRLVLVIFSPYPDFRKYLIESVP